MDEVKQLWTAEFSRIFHSEILIFDNKLTILSGKKHYSYYRQVIAVFVEGIKHISSPEEIEPFVKELIFPLLEDVQYTYLNALISTFKDLPESSIDWGQVESYKEKRNFKYAIVLIESALSIESGLEESNADKAKSASNLIDNSSYTLVLTPIELVLERYSEASNYIMRRYKDSLAGEKNPESNHSDDEFILFVTTSEAWNFLSHISYAYHDSCLSPAKFMKNIERGIHHLERATLDVYKYLIVEYKIKSPEVLSLRTREIFSFGNGENNKLMMDSYYRIVRLEVMSKHPF